MYQGRNYQYNTNDYITPEEVKKIITIGVPAISKKPERDALLLETGWETGGRVSEVLTLVPEHVLEHSMVLINLKQKKDPKGRVPEKLIEVSSVLCDWVKRYCDLYGIKKGQWVFPSPNAGRHLSRVMVFIMITKASEAAHVYRLGKRDARTGGRYKGISYHVLRHSYATHMLQSGSTMKEIQTQLGHADITSTNKYASVVYDNVRAAVAKASVNLYHPPVPGG